MSPCHPRNLRKEHRSQHFHYGQHREYDCRYLPEDALPPSRNGRSYGVLLKPKVCQCQPDFGGIDLHIRRKSCRYLRGSHILRLRFGAGVHEVGDEKFGGGVGSYEVAVVVVKTSDVGVVEPIALAAFDEDTDLSPVPISKLPAN